MNSIIESTEGNPNDEIPRLKRVSMPSREIYAACLSVALESLRKQCKRGVTFGTKSGASFKGHVH